jgi:IclR family acetate operon transcriptional repressor
MLREHASIRAVDVAAELGVARSTAHRMVSTLAQVGLLQRNESDKSYTAGHALVELGMAVLGAADLRAQVAPVLAQLAAETGETAHFLVREGAEVVFVSVAESARVIRAASRVGTRLPAHVTSSGRCLLALLPPEELAALYPARRPLTGGTDAALHSRDALLADLAQVAARGYAINRSESEPGLVAVGAAIRDARGAGLGAISVSGPAERVTAHEADIVTALTGAIGRLERALARRDAG